MVWGGVEAEVDSFRLEYPECKIITQQPNGKRAFHTVYAMKAL